MNTQSRLLFVDDEPGIRLTLSAILQQRGFQVAAAATVAEALHLIATEEFDVLVSDLNIGEPGDGFTVVSAMRRTQPDVPTFILTGFPAIETALEAIRQQVDGYMVKPADIESLVSDIQEKLANPKHAAHRIEAKRLAVILHQTQQEIVDRFLSLAKNDAEICPPTLSDREMTEHLQAVIQELVRSPRDSRQLAVSALKASQEHGRKRFEQGCSIPSMIREARILHESVSRVIEEKLIEIDVSSVVTDVMAVGETLQAFLEESIRSYIQAGTTTGTSSVGN